MRNYFDLLWQAAPAAFFAAVIYPTTYRFETPTPMVWPLAP